MNNIKREKKSFKKYVSTFIKAVTYNGVVISNDS